MRVNLHDLIAQYDQITEERNGKRKWGIDPGKLPAYLMQDYGDILPPLTLR